MLRFHLLLISVILLPRISFAESLKLSDCHQARAYDAPHPELGIVTGEANEHRYFIAPDDPCLTPGSKLACRKKAYVLPKDKIVIFFSAEAFACVGFGNSSSTSIGLLPLNAVQATKLSAPTGSDWQGAWSNDDGEIKIENAKDQQLLHVSGVTALELGSEKDPPLNVHTGELDYDIPRTPGSSELNIRDSSCEARLVYLADYLFVKDNFKCGGAEVSFNGLYRRK